MATSNADCYNQSSQHEREDDEDYNQVKPGSGGTVRNYLSEAMIANMLLPDPQTAAVTGQLMGTDVPAEFTKYRNSRPCTLTVFTPGTGDKYESSFHTFGAIRLRATDKVKAVVNDEQPADEMEVEGGDIVEQEMECVKDQQRDQKKEQRKERKKKEFIHIKWSADSQLPSMVICISRPDKPDVNFRIFPNSISRFYSDPGGASGFEMAFNMTATPNKDLVDPANAQLQELFGENDLRQVSLQLLPAGLTMCPGGTGQRIARPQWYNISDQEVKYFVDRWHRRETLEPWQHAIAMLHIGHDIILHERVIKDDIDLYKRFCDHMQVCFTQCCKHGFYWFWAKQHLGPITQAPKPWLDAPVPTWLVTSWLIKTGANYEETCEPFSWASFNRPLVYPDMQAACTAHMLGLARGIGTMQGVLKERLADEAGKIDAFFKPIPGAANTISTEDAFIVDVYCNLQTFYLGGLSLIPEPRTQIKIIFEAPETNQAESIEKYVYYGEIVENLLETQHVSFVARVTGKTFWKFGMESVGKCSIELTGTNISLQRQHVVFQIAAHGLTRTDRGVDWDRLLFDTAAAPCDVSRNAWTDEIKQYSGFKDEFLREARATFQLNDKQIELTKHFLENDTGVSILFGPPGTGKSNNLMAIIMLYLTLNKDYRKKLSKPGPAKKVLVTAPSNIAVDELLSKCLKHSSAFEGMKLIRFKGGNPSKRAKKDVTMAGTNEEPDSWQPETLEEAYWNFMEANLADNKNASEAELKEYEFVYHFHYTLKSWPDDHPSKQDANAYRTILDNVNDPNIKLSRYQRKQLTLEKNLLQQRLYAAYFKEIDGVFCTLNSAMHEILQHFDPSCLFMDEAARALLGDKLTGIVPNIETLENVVLSGDSQQIRGRVSNEGRNEFFDISQDSLMHKVWERNQSGKNPGFDFVQLEEQYRMHPDIGRPISRIFYQGKLVHADVTKQVQPVCNTAKHFFKTKFGTAYGGNHRFGIDCSGENNESEYWKDSKSSHNPAEAEAICLMIRGLLQHEPLADGQRVEPRNIIITTDYSGQESHLKIELARLSYTVGNVTRPLAGTGENRIRVTTTSKTQGSEGDIQFISMVMNKVKNVNGVSFIATPELLNVKFSRAKFMQIVVGNFQPWLNAIKNKWGTWSSSGKKSEFVQMISSFWPDNNPASCKVISQRDFVSGMKNNSAPTKNCFPSLITIKKRPADAAGFKLQPSKRQQKKLESAAPLNSEDATKLNERRAALPDPLDTLAMQAALDEVQNDETLSSPLRVAMIKMIERCGARGRD